MALFRKYAADPELAKLINLLVFGGSGPAVENNRTDLVGIFIPDMIRVDLLSGIHSISGREAETGGSNRSRRTS